jgi:hyaluronate lyase
MSSDTIHKYESINGENQRGWYFSDGFLMLYPHEKTRNHGKEFFLYSNPYLRTSVTANTAERVAKCIHPSIQNGSPYAGGVECGKYGSAGFVLKYKDGFTQGTFTNANDSKITANKSWFFFDNEIVCLGSDITDKSGTPVITCIDNCQWLEGESLSVGGKAYTPTEETEISGKYAHFTGIGGYVFFDDNKVKYKKATHNNLFKPEDTQTYDFLEIVMHHGIGDEKLNGAYAYAYLPASSEEKTASYSKNPDIEILSLTKNVHAVYEKNLGILAVNFFDADKFNSNGYSIEAKTVCSVMIRDNVLYVSDPTGKLDFVELVVNGKTVSQKTSDSYGKTYQFTLN